VIPPTSAGVPAVPRAQRPGRPGRDLVIIVLDEQRHHSEKYTRTRGGSFPSDRFALRPAPALASSMTSRGIDDASTPSNIWPFHRLPAATSAFCVTSRDDRRPPASADGSTGQQDQLTVSGIGPCAPTEDDQTVAFPQRRRRRQVAMAGHRRHGGQACPRERPGPRGTGKRHDRPARLIEGNAPWAGAKHGTSSRPHIPGGSSNPGNNKLTRIIYTPETTGSR
jgi:hypothetical protein